MNYSVREIENNSNIFNEIIDSIYKHFRKIQEKNNYKTQWYHYNIARSLYNLHPTLFSMFFEHHPEKEMKYKFSTYNREIADHREDINKAYVKFLKKQLRESRKGLPVYKRNDAEYPADKYILYMIADRGLNECLKVGQSTDFAHRAKTYLSSTPNGRFVGYYKCKNEKDLNAKEAQCQRFLAEIAKGIMINTDEWYVVDDSFMDKCVINSFGIFDFLERGNILPLSVVIIIVKSLISKI